MNTQQLQEEIRALKRKAGVTLLAHSYQSYEITELADCVGDSFQLSKFARDCDGDKILLCGVKFMAETAKLLAPQKDVYLANSLATCPMAEQFTPADVEAARAKYPGCAVVAYINTTAALKAVCDVCVTSSSAVEIVKKLPQEDILFLPDCNLGAYVQKQLPQKRIHLMEGGCPVHASVTAEELSAARAAWPDAEVLVHPECIPAVTNGADFAGATSAILSRAKQSDKREFIIGTELSIAAALKIECPDKCFYPLSKKLFCADMRLTTLADVHARLTEIAAGKAVPLTLSPQEQNARRSIDEMLRLGAGGQCPHP